MTQASSISDSVCISSITVKGKSVRLRKRGVVSGCCKEQERGEECDEVLALGDQGQRRGQRDTG